MEGMGKLPVSFRGVNNGFWSHLGCSGQNTDIFNHEGFACEEMKHHHTVLVV